MGGKIRELQAAKALQKCGTIAVQHVQDTGIIAGQGTIVDSNQRAGAFHKISRRLEPQQDAARHFTSGLVVAGEMRRAVRADGAAFRLGQIMQKNTPPQNAGIFIVHARHIQQFHRHGGVLPHIIAVPAPRLGAADAWLNLRHRPGKNPSIAAQHFARSGGGQQLIQLGINALGGNILDALPHVQRGALGGFLQSKIQLGGQPHRAQDAQDNLWLDETAALKIGDLGLDKQAHIGVSGAAEQTILTGYADDFSENFTSDDLTLTISAARENGFTELTLQEAVYTLTLDPGEGSEPVTLEAEQGKSLHELNVQAPERENMTFDGWYTEEGDCVDAEAPLHLTGDTTLSARWTQAEPQSAEAALLTYDPDAPITKQEAAKTLYQMARQLGLDTEAGQEVDLTQFEDADEISEDAADAVRWAYAADLLTEKDGKLHVTDELTRKELTRMLEDFLDLI